VLLGRLLLQLLRHATCSSSSWQMRRALQLGQQVQARQAQALQAQQGSPQGAPCAAARCPLTLCSTLPPAPALPVCSCRQGSSLGGEGGQQQAQQAARSVRLASCPAALSLQRWTLALRPRLRLVARVVAG
jgi:hypothetical protein